MFWNADRSLSGEYRLTLYKNELEVAHGEVTVSAARTVSAGMVHPDDPEAVPALWRIGHWDGSPQELLNGDKVTTMHPSDVRMVSWQTGPYIVGQSSPAHDFPAYQWMDVNNDVHIRFALTQQPTSDLILRVGITAAQFHGRPGVSLNNWQSKPMEASKQPTSRTLTVGTYRGNNTAYAFTIPAGAFRTGVNELILHVISGSQGKRFLSPGVAYDAIDLVQNGRAPVESGGK